MVYSKRQFLISRIMRWRLIKKHGKAMTCPNCHGTDIELINQMEVEVNYSIIKQYLCHDCDCEWDWTLQRQFFRWRQKIRAPKWVEID